MTRLAVRWWILRLLIHEQLKVWQKWKRRYLGYGMGSFKGIFRLVKMDCGPGFFFPELYWRWNILVVIDRRLF
jgi:hypothetical protein